MGRGGDREAEFYRGIGYVKHKALLTRETPPLPSCLRLRPEETDPAEPPGSQPEVIYETVFRLFFFFFTVDIVCGRTRSHESRYYEGAAKRHL